MKNCVNCFLAFVFAFVPSTAFSQEDHFDLPTLFSQHLLLEKVMVVENKITGEMSYDPQNITIEIDSISKYDVDIVFYSFTLGKNGLGLKDSSLEITIYSSICDTYILAVNVRNFKSYRLKGFAGNDLLFLLNDINKIKLKKIPNKRLGKNLQALEVGVDFKCLLKSFKKINMNKECLTACNSPKASHGKNKNK